LPYSVVITANYVLYTSISVDGCAVLEYLIIHLI